MSTELWLRFDIRGASRDVSSATLCAAALEQAVWAEHNGFDAVLFGEHHGTDDGYLPSPMMLAAAVAARTQRIRLELGVLVLPLSHPLRVVEDVCVLDNISQGRVDVSVGVGYVPSEFEMFGVDIKQRATLMDEGIAAMRGGFSGEPFLYRGRKVRISPAPAQPGGPEILVSGAIKASALRAARLGDGFFPTVVTDELLDVYRAECVRLGKPVGRIVDMTGPMSIFVSNDPEREWSRVGPSMMHEMNTYSRWARDSGTATPFAHDVTDMETLKATGVYEIFTPEECVAFFNRQRDTARSIMFNPLCGGLNPDIAWESLELIAAEVLPKFKHKPGSRTATK